MYCDIAFIGADVMSVKNGIYTLLISVAAISRIMIKNTKKILVVLYSS
jgi:DeoR/GlpR family transcriptional regulator of sugar metabolism